MNVDSAQVSELRATIESRRRRFAIAAIASAVAAMAATILTRSAVPYVAFVAVFALLTATLSIRNERSFREAGV